MTIDKKLLYELAEQAVDTEELVVVTTSNVEKWIAAARVKSGKTYIPNEVVYLHYKTWCDDSGEKALSYVPFFKVLNKLIKGKSSSRRYFDASSFDTSTEYYFRARQMMLRLLPIRALKDRRLIRKKSSEKTTQENQKNKKNSGI